MEPTTNNTPSPETRPINLDMTISPQVIALLPAQIARRLMALPLSCEDGVLRVAVADPNDLDISDTLSLSLGHRFRVELVQADPEALRSALNTHYAEKFTGLPPDLTGETFPPPLRR